MYGVQEIELARDRNPREGRVRQGAFTLKQVKRWVLTLDIVRVNDSPRPSPFPMGTDSTYGHGSETNTRQWMLWIISL